MWRARLAGARILLNRRRRKLADFPWFYRFVRSIRLFADVPIGRFASSLAGGRIRAFPCPGFPVILSENHFIMHSFHYSIAATTVVCGLFQLARAQDHPRSIEPLYVRADSLSQPWSLTEHIVGADHLRTADAGAIIGKLPGAAIVRNGPQTGIVQLRGLSGDRVAVRVDGMTITPACPNHMDPPLHYAAAGAGDLVDMYAGISPVSAGGDHIGGSLSIARAEPVFADGAASLFRGKLGASFLGSQDAALATADLTFAQGDAGFQYRGSGETADDLRYAGGTVADSSYETTHHEIIGAWRTNGGYLAVDAGFSATRDAGTPALPMDMIKDDAWKFGLAQKEKFGWGTLENRLYVHDIDHLMDNFSQRPVVMGGMAMEAPSSSRDYGWTGGVMLPRGDSRLRTGIDLHRNEFDAEQVATATGMRRDTFNDNVRSRAGAYIDWENDWSEKWTTRIGLRGDVVTSDADAVNNGIMPMGMILADQNAFNSADRSFTDMLPGAAAAVSFEPDDTTTIELALALNSRAPSLVERYLWTPLNASAGLADGRTYLGNLDLDPETSFQVGLGLEKHGKTWNAELTPFYQSVNDYIQGMPLARLDMAGQPVLQYQNIDRAELYGVELAGGYDINRDFSIDSSISYVRGRNKDTGDDLYRIAPLRGIMDLAYRHESWESHLEWMWADAQNHVSDMQGETPSPGYGFLNFRLAKVFLKTLRVEAGVENLLDKRYADHLGGVNRVAGGDLAAGERIPGAGRFAYTSVSWEF
jgi:iron complex outermembrane receptor protein